MSVSRSFRALELYDVLTNLVPGAVLVLAISAIFRVEEYVQFSTSTFAAGTFLVSALVFGHVIQVVASELDGTPTLFGEIIRVGQGEEVDNVEISITSVEEAVWPLMKRKFALPDNYSDYGSLFRLLLSYIETTPATRALRFQALHAFHRSMWAVGFIILILALTAILLKCMAIVGVRSWPILGLTITGSFVGIVVFKRRKEKINRRFIQYAIADFYTDQLNEINGRKHGSGS